MAALVVRDGEDDGGQPRRSFPVAQGPAGDGPGGAGVSAGGGLRGSGSGRVHRPPRRTRYDAGGVLVKFKRGTPEDVVEALLEQVDGSEDGAVRRLRVSELDVDPGDESEAVEALEESPWVEYAERDVVVEKLATKPNDAYWHLQWGQALIGTPAAWDVTRGAATVVVAVVDTGVDATHPDLRGAVLGGYDFVNLDADAADDEGHGTAVAGVIAARADNREGLAGVCSECAILPVKVLDSAGAGDTSTVARGIVWAADNGADVINLSLGAPAGTATLADAVAYALRRGAIVVAAAGNDGRNAFTYPAAYPQTVSVAATDRNDGLYTWSNYGTWVQVAAPGCNVATARGGGYLDFCGTSSATPVVAGIAALGVASKGKGIARTIEQALGTSATRLAGAVVLHGRVDAAGTMRTLGAVPAASVPQAAAPTPSTFSGVARAGVARRHEVTLAPGGVSLVLTSSVRTPFTVALVDQRGRTVGRVSGRSPLRLVRRLPGTRLTVVVSSRTPRAGYRVVVASAAGA